MHAGQTIALPDAEERAVYVAQGSLQVRGTAIPVHSMAIFADVAGVVLEAAEESRIVIIGGECLGERLIEWNFASSRKERIEQAKRDWKQGRFPKIPGDEIEFIPLPE